MYAPYIKKVHVSIDSKEDPSISFKPNNNYEYHALLETASNLYSLKKYRDSTSISTYILVDDISGMYMSSLLNMKDTNYRYMSMFFRKDTNLYLLDVQLHTTLPAGNTHDTRSVHEVISRYRSPDTNKAKIRSNILVTKAKKEQRTVSVYVDTYPNSYVLDGIYQYISDIEKILPKELMFHYLNMSGLIV